MRPFNYDGEHAARRRLRVGAPAPTPTPPPLPPPTGFTGNGAPNAALKAMLARVAAGSGRGRLIVAGDSTTVGQGAGTSADPLYLTGARPNRTSVVLASLLTAAGTPARDTSIVGDHAIQAASFSAQRYFDYDARAANSGFAFNNAAAFAGGGLYGATSAPNALTLTESNVDTFEVVLYNIGASTLEILIDGAPPAAGGGTVHTSSSTGFARFSFKAANVGAHTLTLSAPISGSANIRSIAAYDSTAAGVDLSIYAQCGGVASDANATGSSYHAGNSLLFDAPDLTIINFGLNEMATGVSTSAYAAAIGGLVDKAKVSGDALLVFPHPISTVTLSTMQAYRDVAAGLAAAKGVAFLSLFDYFGGSFTPAFAARMQDGQVHGRAEFYAEVADVYRRCIQAMAG